MSGSSSSENQARIPAPTESSPAVGAKVNPSRSQVGFASRRPNIASHWWGARTSGVNPSSTAIPRYPRPAPSGATRSSTGWPKTSEDLGLHRRRPGVRGHGDEQRVDHRSSQRRRREPRDHRTSGRDGPGTRARGRRARGSSGTTTRPSPSRPRPSRRRTSPARRQTPARRPGTGTRGAGRTRRSGSGGSLVQTGRVEHRILVDLRRVVDHPEAGEERAVPAAAPGPGPAPGGAARGVPVVRVGEPEVLELARVVQLLPLDRARIAVVAGVLREAVQRPVVLGHPANLAALPGRVQRVLVESAEARPLVGGPHALVLDLLLGVVRDGDVPVGVVGQRVDDDLLLAAAGDRPDEQRQRPVLGRVPELERRQAGGGVGDGVEVDLGGEEVRAGVDVALEDVLAALRDRVALELEPGVQAVGPLGGQERHVVLGDLELGLDGDRAGGGLEVNVDRHGLERVVGGVGAAAPEREAAPEGRHVDGVAAGVGHEPRGAVPVEPVDDGGIDGADPVGLEALGDRDQQREVGERPLVVGDQRERGLVALSSEDHLAGPVDELDARRAHVRAAKRMCGSNPPEEQRHSILPVPRPGRILDIRGREPQTVFEVSGHAGRPRGRTLSQSSSRFEVRGSRFEVRGSRFEVRGSRFEVRGSRFEVRGSRFEVRGSRFEVRSRIRFRIRFRSRFRIRIRSRTRSRIRTRSYSASPRSPPPSRTSAAAPPHLLDRHPLAVAVHRVGHVAARPRTARSRTRAPRADGTTTSR